ncbi:uncharacterized protein LOC142344426 isoform X3 [Convolutriloba macropyga]|uniref:uncharacterized protein LOC142344426 isoform X3 n=1 Tax=Convolutriloba macropyga TaxID=536237 RepID=UPI003F527CCA
MKMEERCDSQNEKLDECSSQGSYSSCQSIGPHFESEISPTSSSAKPSLNGEPFRKTHCEIEEELEHQKALLSRNSQANSSSDDNHQTFRNLSTDSSQYSEDYNVEDATARDEVEDKWYDASTGDVESHDQDPDISDSSEPCDQQRVTDSLRVNLEVPDFSDLFRGETENATELVTSESPTSNVNFTQGNIAQRSNLSIPDLSQQQPGTSGIETTERESPASPTPSFDEQSVTPGPVRAPDVRVCTETRHTSMCRAPSPRYYKGTDVDALVEETDSTMGDAVFSEKVPELVVDETDSICAMSDFGFNGSSSDSSSSSSTSRRSSGSSFFDDRNLSDDLEALDDVLPNETETQFYSVQGAAAARENEDNSDGVPRQQETSETNVAGVTTSDPNTPGNTADGVPVSNAESSQPPPTEPNPDPESSDDGLRFLRGRLTGRRKRKMSTVKEPNPYQAPPLPSRNWRAFRDIDRLRRGVLSCERYKAEIQRSQHFIQRWDKDCALHGHRGCVNALNFNDSGTLLASAGDDLNVILWDWTRRKEKLKYESGHHSNVFQAKFLPHCNDTSIVTCARDGQVRHGSLSSTGHTYTNKLAQHKMSAHKMAVMRDSPCEFLTCGEDGYVFHLDIRQTYSKKPLPILTVNDDKDRPIELYAIDSRPSNENQFLVCGRDPNVLIYDRRNLNSGPVCKYRPKGIGEDDYRMSITCAVYSKLGTEIVASYSDEDIYVFDVDHHQIPCSDDSCDESPSSSQHGLNGRKESRDRSNIADPKHFFGHRNNQTVKGVNFLGPDSEYVVSGSDDGHIYIWEKETQKIVQWLPGDEAGVVNVLEPHPTLPVMATSGLDHCVKLWSPKRLRQHNLLGLASTMAQNKKMRESDPNRDGLFDARMLMLLMQSLNSSASERRQNGANALDDDDLDSDGEEVGRTGGATITIQHGRRPRRGAGTGDEGNVDRDDSNDEDLNRGANEDDDESRQVVGCRTS